MPLNINDPPVIVYISSIADRYDSHFFDTVSLSAQLKLLWEIPSLPKWSYELSPSVNSSKWQEKGAARRVDDTHRAITGI